jgi:mannose/cellobiose epimerase-like protein (N-acyl-D-glucosamine 2-epimerase family)
MTHVFALAHLMGIPGAGSLVDRGVAALLSQAFDERHGGWFEFLAPTTEDQKKKTAYVHAFVLLAATSARLAQRNDADELLSRVTEVIEERFWDEKAGRCVDAWSSDWEVLDNYRGANSNMHLVESFLALADSKGDVLWRDRALRIAEFFIHEVASKFEWRVPEHYDECWEPLLEYGRGAPNHQFRPYGSTPGHWMEWSRLLLSIEAAYETPPPWLFMDAQALFRTAIAMGWAVDGQDGFVYTLDWENKPAVRSRPHWVIAEAIGAAATLGKRSQNSEYELWYRRWWDYVSSNVIDETLGSWHHELDPTNQPRETTWRGKPDVYHAFQATIIPQLPQISSLAGALSRRQPLGIGGRLV